MKNLLGILTLKAKLPFGYYEIWGDFLITRMQNTNAEHEYITQLAKPKFLHEKERFITKLHFGCINLDSSFIQHEHIKMMNISLRLTE